MSWDCRYQQYKNNIVFCLLLNKECKVLQKGCVLSRKVKILTKEKDLVNDKKSRNLRVERR